MDGGLRSRARCLAAALGAAAAIAVGAAVPAVAATHGPVGHNPHGRMLGASDALPVAGARARRLEPAATGGPLTYHGGPVVHDGHVYAIFWEPPGYVFPSDYRWAIAKYFQDVAADSGRRTNVYSTSRQYGDRVGAAAYRVAFEGYYTDTNPLPASDCVDPGTSACLTDAAVRNELGAFMSAQGLPRGLARQYFVFTPPGVGTCFETSGPCAFQVYCAYHSWFGSLGTVLYAVHPFVMGAANCDTGQSPTGTSADAVLNVVSHEHNEIITDPTGGGWYDTDGEENGDKCVWRWGGTQGFAGAAFNQLIAGSAYLLQQEWSNLDGGCALTTANLAPRPSFQRVSAAVARSPVRFNAGLTRDLDGSISTYAWRFGDGRKGSGVAPAHKYPKAGTYRVQLRATDDEGASATRTVTVKVAKKKKTAAAARY